MGNVDDDFLYNAEFIEDRVTISLAALQSEQGFSDGEIVFGVLSAVSEWIVATKGQDRKSALDMLNDLIEEAGSDSVREPDWQRHVAIARCRDDRKSSPAN